MHSIRERTFVLFIFEHSVPVLFVFLITVTKFQTYIPKGRDDSFCSQSQSSVHGCLTPCIWAEHHSGGACVTEKFLHLMADRRQRKKQEGARTSYPQGLAPSDLLPPAMSHLLKFPEPSKIAPPVTE
jgi:hypothetical protein